MTSQAVLLNAWGVALASDSAVSSGAKVMHGSEKIYHLPAPHKIAVLTSANARIMEFPWEGVLSAWSDSLTKPLESVGDYYKSLTKWLANSLSSTSEISASELRFLDGIVFTDLKNALIDVLWIENLKELLSSKLSPEDYEEAGGTDWTPEFNEKVLKVIGKSVRQDLVKKVLEIGEYRKSNAEAYNVTLGQAQVWVSKYKEKFESTYERSFEYCTTLEPGLPNFPELNEAISHVANIFLAYPNYKAGTTLCFAGFGENDLLPSAMEIDIFGTCGGVVLQNGFLETGPVERSRAWFFGQREAIDSLVFGYDSLFEKATEQVTQTLTKLGAEIPDTGDERGTNFRQAFESAIESVKLEEVVANESDETRRKPFLKALEMSPVKDLAEFAGTLVSVQAARAAFTQDNPTVGGPVDVAVITRHDGFTWIRRK